MNSFIGLEDKLSIHFSPFSSEFLEKLLEEIEVTQTQYEQAQRAYRSLGKWLERPKSELHKRNPDVYVQGSFRLGTAIGPSSPDDDLDIDVICEINGSKKEDTQRLIKKFVGYEVKSYADANRITLDKPGNRCWTLLYADDSRFHMDVLPAISDAEDRRHLLERRELDAKWTDTALAITDRDTQISREFLQIGRIAIPRVLRLGLHSKAAIFIENVDMPSLRKSAAAHLRASMTYLCFVSRHPFKVLYNF